MLVIAGHSVSLMPLHTLHWQYVTMRVAEMAMIVKMCLWRGYHCGVVAIVVWLPLWRGRYFVVDTAKVKRIKHRVSYPHRQFLGGDFGLLAQDLVAV